ncbi:DUF6141 family protein [Sphingobacterium chungjuense]|uniref:DUF6141 family protein n=1 Tax=Sphingobacterium chungjuense TaxID=2675553 RepID=UPI00140CAF69|nr:DUF6141 family protein [Sphingobacterium chungjuense]
MPTILFKESTKLHKAIIIPFIASYFLLLYGAVRQLLYGTPLGTKPMSDIHLIIFTVCCGILILLLGNVRSELKITEAGFYICTIPLIRGDLNRWNRIKEIRIEKYSPIKEHLGIGFRGINTQMAYLAGGQPGIKLIFHNGDKMLLAARDQEKLLNILRDDLALIVQKDSDLLESKQLH